MKKKSDKRLVFKISSTISKYNQHLKMIIWMKIGKKTLVDIFQECHRTID